MVNNIAAKGDEKDDGEESTGIRFHGISLASAGRHHSVSDWTAKFRIKRDKKANKCGKKGDSGCKIREVQGKEGRRKWGEEDLRKDEGNEERGNGKKRGGGEQTKGKARAKGAIATEGAGRRGGDRWFTLVIQGRSRSDECVGKTRTGTVYTPEYIFIHMMTWRGGGEEKRRRRRELETTETELKDMAWRAWAREEGVGEGVEEAGGEGDAEEVVEEGPKEVLADDAEGGAGRVGGRRGGGRGHCGGG